MPELLLDQWWPLLLLPLLYPLVKLSLAGLPLQPGRRAWPIALLRAFSFVLVLLLLCGPELRWETQLEEKAVLAVLLDNSSSMQELDANLRLDEWLDALEHELDVRTRIFTFGDSLREIASGQALELQSANQITDLESALASLERELAGEHWTGLLIASDGCVNHGAWPIERARELGRPVWTAGSGRLEQAADLQLNTVLANDPVQAGHEQPMRVYLSSVSLEGARARLTLAVEGLAVDSTEVVLAGDHLEQEFMLEWTPVGSGNRRITLEAELLDMQESQLRNNSRTLQVEILPEKQRALLLAGSVSPDLAFLRRGLDAMHETLALSFVMPDRGDVAESRLLSELERADVVILAHWPQQRSSRTLIKAVQELGKPLLWLGGNGASAANYFPGYRSAGTAPAATGAARVHELHAVLGDENRFDQADAIWREMPPLWNKDKSIWPQGWRSLLRGSEGQDLLLLKDTGLDRVLCLPASGYWKWELAGGLRPDLQLRARQLRESLLRWLLRGETARPFRVWPEDKVWSSGRPLPFYADVKDETGSPLGDAEVRLRLQNSSKDQDLEIVLLAVESGHYGGTVSGLEAGDWSWHATAGSGERAQLADSGRVLVESFSRELLDGVRNERLLREMAQQCGGRYLDLDVPGAVSELLSASTFTELERRPRLQERAQRRLAIEEWALLLLLLCSLSLEWTLRRMGGML